MDAAVQEHDHYTEVIARGRLNLGGAPVLRSAVASALESGSRRLIVNMDGIDSMDSTGLGTLVACLKATREHGGDLRIANVNARVRTVLEMSGTDAILTPYESVEHARSNS